MSTSAEKISIVETRDMCTIEHYTRSHSSFRSQQISSAAIERRITRMKVKTIKYRFDESVDGRGGVDAGAVEVEFGGRGELPLSARSQSDVRIDAEVPHQLQPARMSHQRLIKFRRRRADLNE